MSKAGAAFLVIAFLIVAFGISVLFSAVIIGFIGALYFDASWEQGWHAAWERWGWTLFFGVFVFGGGLTSRK